MARKRKKAAPPPPKPARRRRWLIATLSTLGVLLVGTLIVAPMVETFPPGRGWQDMGDGHGHARFAGVTRGYAIIPPTAPEWVRTLRRYHIPWPTDMPLEALPASFGPPPGALSDTTAAWFIVRCSPQEKSLWGIDKTSVTLSDAEGSRVFPLDGGPGAAVIDPDRKTQYVYLTIPQDLSAARTARVQFRLRLDRDTPSGGREPIYSRPLTFDVSW